MTLMEAATMSPDETSIETNAADAIVSAISQRYAEDDTQSFLEAMLGSEFRGRMALVSSFGAEAAILLHMVSRRFPETPVIFLNTGKLFGETLKYRDALVERFGLTDVRSVKPDPTRLDRLDRDGVLWYGNPNMCCHIRKVEPMQEALAGFDAWITGRKGYQGGERSGLPRVEPTDDGRVRVNPLADWSKVDIDAYFAEHDLPRHPLEADGFLSIGCMPCTDRVRPGEDARAGRWRGRDKSECGIHVDAAKWRMMGIDGDGQ
jgi:phosphoadenosine phosphosulfate reductase